MPVINENEAPSKRASFIKDYRRLRRLVQSGAAFCAFDTETTGLDYKKDKIIEIGAVKFDRNGVIDRFDSFIKIDFPLPPLITQITHITDQMIASSPSAAVVLGGFEEFSRGTILVAHNAQFDYNFVSQGLSDSSLLPLKNKVIDTLQAARWAYPKNGKFSLQYLAAGLKIDVHAAHRADDDARVCMELLLRIIRDTDSVQKI